MASCFLYKRREFITLLGGAAVAYPLAARAQQPAMPTIGFLNSESPDRFASNVRAFLEGLSQAGYVEGKNVAIEYRWAESRYDRLPAMAADLASRKVAVIATPASTPAALAAKAATTTIPIVFGIGGDPVQTGLVANLNRPGGNVTGYSSMNAELAAKQVGLLHELLPAASHFAVLVNPANLSNELVTRDVQTGAAALGLQIEVLSASTNRDITTAFTTLLQKRAGGLLVSPDPLFVSRHTQFVTLAARHAVPTINFDRAFAEAGGLMSYGTSLADHFRQVGIYTGRILKGEKPGELPVARPTKFEFVINLQTAQVLGLTVPDSLLARADEVIE
jgi:putative tryptophan/tyrosine transport system substrate-binding protein